jgi:prepilin-type N-terminal cleavage/methylation domain-containing protein
MSKQQGTVKQYGFTVIEMLVALAIFSVVLVVVTAAIIQISQIYYKGVNETQVQSTARAITDTVSQAIQFGGGTVTDTVASPTPGGSYAFCISNREYSYRPGYKLVDNTPGTNQTRHGMVVRTVAGCTGGTSGQDLSVASVSGRELMSPGMRLSKMVVKNVGPNLYQVQVRVVYGDDDLLYSPSAPASPNGMLAQDATCRGTAGRQFCAVSELNTVVISRVK